MKTAQALGLTIPPSLLNQVTDEQGEWQVDGHPAALHGGKSSSCAATKGRGPAVVKYVTWPVHEKVTVRRQA